MSYKEWIKANPEIIETESCEECDGEGKIECELCGHISTCDYCGGSGGSSDAPRLYREQLEKDESGLKNFVTG